MANVRIWIWCAISLIAACGRAVEPDMPGTGGTPISFPNLDGAMPGDGGSAREGGAGLDGGKLPTVDGGGGLPGLDGGPMTADCPAEAPIPGSMCSVNSTCLWNDACGKQNLFGLCEQGVWNTIYMPGACADGYLSYCAEGSYCSAHTQCVSIEQGCTVHYGCLAGALHKDGQDCTLI